MTSKKYHKNILKHKNNKVIHKKTGSITMKVVGVTACPTGVAHTYMSAEALVLAGEKYGIDVKIETQGTAGIENNLTEEDIKEAACVILSTDVAIQGEERFHGKKVMRMGVQDLMKKAEPIMKKIKDTFDK